MVPLCRLMVVRTASVTRLSRASTAASPDSKAIAFTPTVFTMSTVTCLTTAGRAEDRHTISSQCTPPPPPPVGDDRLDAPGQRPGHLPSSVWTQHREVKQGKSGGSVGTTDQGKGKGSGEGMIGQGRRGRTQGGERLMGTTAYGGKGSEERAANGHWPVGAASCRRTTHHGNMPAPPPPGRQQAGRRSKGGGAPPPLKEHMTGGQGCP